MERIGPLRGVKVVNFSWVATGPSIVKYLGDHGATVVRVESHTHPDPIRFMTPFKDYMPNVNYSGFFAEYNSSSYGITLDLSKPRGREIARKLIMWADVLVESFTPGEMKRRELDYESVRKLKPDIIYLSTCQLGQSGPRARYSGYGTLLSALTGFSHLNGWPDGPPMTVHGAWNDYISMRLGAAALLAALDYRRRTGRGQYLDQSQFESSMHFLAPLVMEQRISGRTVERNGNRVPHAAPHGVYPCQGEDRWCAIAVFDDQEWRGFCEAIGQPGLMTDDRFSTLVGRKRNEDELDRLVAEWTNDHTAEEIEALMQSAGVPASMVESVADLFEDPQLKHRGHFRWLQHSVMGRHAYNGPAFRLAKTPDTQFAAPAMGEHNEYVYKQILGLSDDEIAELLVERVITTEDDLPKMRVSF